MLGHGVPIADKVDQRIDADIGRPANKAEEDERLGTASLHDCNCPELSF